MDNPFNQLLVQEIKREVVTASLNEAFLESAPQLIIQLAIFFFEELEKVFE
jgi:hypothetical protein